WVMYSLAGGASSPRQAIWYSRDAERWVLDRRTFVNRIEISGNSASRVNMRAAHPCMWRGDMWSAFEVQGASYVARLADDLRSFKGIPQQTNFVPEWV